MPRGKHEGKKSEAQKETEKQIKEAVSETNKLHKAITKAFRGK